MYIFLCFYKISKTLKALNELAKRHGNVVKQTYQEGVVKKWGLDEHSHGAFVLYGVGQRGHFKVGIRNAMTTLLSTYEQKHLMEPFGNVLFAAEYTNKVSNVNKC